MLLEIAQWLVITPADLVGWLTALTVAGAITTFALIATTLVLWQRRRAVLLTHTVQLQAHHDALQMQAAAMQRQDTLMAGMRAEVDELKLEARRARRERLRLNRKLTTIEEVLQAVLSEMRDMKQGDNMRNIFRQEAALLLHLPGPAQHVTVAGGERSAAIGRDVRRSPVVTGDDNEMDT